MHEQPGIACTHKHIGGNQTMRADLLITGNNSCIAIQTRSRSPHFDIETRWHIENLAPALQNVFKAENNIRTGMNNAHGTLGGPKIAHRVGIS